METEKKRLGDVEVLKTVISALLFLYFAPSFSQHQISRVAIQVPEADGRMLVRPGELLMQENARGTVLLCHGFKRDQSDTRVLRTLFKDYNTLIFDFRAHGKKRGNECCSFGQYEAADIKAAVDFIKHHPQLKDKPVIGYGMSMGAAALILAQSQASLFDALILDSPFDTMQSVIDRGLNRLSMSVGGYDVAAPLKKVLSSYAFDPNMNSVLRFFLKIAGMDASAISTCVQPVAPQEAIKNVTVPCFIIGCEADKQVPREAFERVHQAHAGTKELWVSPGRGHVDSFFYQPEEYSQKVTQFLSKVVSAPTNFQIAYKQKR